MCDVEAQVPPKTIIKRNFTVNLFIRTIYHIIYTVLNLFVLTWGCVIWFQIDDELQQDEILKNLKILAPFFFTNWNYSFQTAFLGLSLIHDLLEWLDLHKGYLGAKIKYWSDVIFSGMVFPFTLFVTGMFWSVYAIDRELVFPKVYDKIVPWWFNHCVHTNVTVVLVIETFLQSRRKPADKRMELILYWTVAFLYAIVYYTIYFTTGRWLYQVFGVMNWWQVCLYQLFIWIVSYVFYVAQFPINRLIHGPSTDKKPNDRTCDKDAKTVSENEDEKEKMTGESKSSKFQSMTCRNTEDNLENSRL